MSSYSDIRETGWVRFLPRRLIPYAILARFDRPIGAWLLFLPGLWGILLAAQTPLLASWLVFLFAIGAVVMRGAGCIVNDLWDRKMDAQVERTRGRPLASGILKPMDALVFLALLCAIGLLILSQLDRAAQALGVLSLVLVGLYPLAKRVTWWPQIMLGFTFGWGTLMGVASACGHLTLATAPLYAAAIFWILGYDTIYAHQDREDDALIGVRSTARLFGAKTKEFLIVCYGAMLFLLLLAMMLAQLNGYGIMLLAIPTGLLVRQVMLLDINDPALCLRLFKSNREVGLSVAFAILIGHL